MSSTRSFPSFFNDSIIGSINSFTSLSPSHKSKSCFKIRRVSLIELIETFFKNVDGAINEKLYGYWNKYKSFIQDLGHIQNWIGWAWDKFVNFFRDTLGGIWDAIGGAWHKFVSFFQSIGGFASFAGITAANGYDGVVTRPTMMMVGERGAERVSVTPSGQTGGGGVTINIQNMVGSSGDIERLRSMILDVLQSSSSNRVRI